MPREKPVKVSLDWKSSVPKCRGCGSNPELIGANQGGKIHCTNMLP